MLKKNVTTKILIVFISILIVALIFVKYPITSSQIDGVISSVFATSGIIIALLLTFVFSKISNIRSAKEERKKEIDKLAYKVTEFRRFLYYVLKCRKFWGNYSDIENLKRHYSGYSYSDFHNNYNDEKASYYWSEEDRFSTVRTDVFLGLEEIVGKEKSIDWVLNENRTFDYSLDEIACFLNSGTVLWYYFSHKWHKYSDGKFDFFELSRDYHSAKMKEHVSNIDEKFEGRNLDRDLLADVGSDMHEKHLDKLYDLTLMNEGKLPRTVNMVIIVTIIVSIFGVIFPLLGSFGNFPYLYDSWIVFISVTVLVACIIWILLDFLSLIKSEIKV